MIRIQIFIVFLLLSCTAFSQSIMDLQNEIDSLMIEKDYEQVLIKSSNQKNLVDLQYYDIVYKSAILEKDTFKLISLFTTARKIQYYLYQDESYFFARDIYVESTKSLINLIENDLVKLKAISILPSVKVLLYPILKKKILNLGGIWEKGEIPTYYPGIPLRGSLIPDSTSINKN